VYEIEPSYVPKQELMRYFTSKSDGFQCSENLLVNNNVLLRHAYVTIKMGPKMGWKDANWVRKIEMINLVGATYLPLGTRLHQARNTDQASTTQ
jgi:hypothetical protein